MKRSALSGKVHDSFPFVWGARMNPLDWNFNPTMILKPQNKTYISMRLNFFNQ